MPPPAGNTERRSRPSYLAAPPLLAESEPFEGAAVLQEHPGALGVVLWKTLRDVTAWMEAAPADRAALFSPAAAAARPREVADCAAEPELWAPLLVVAQLVRAPDAVNYPRLVNACRAVARWAERRGFGAVQLAFTQAAARLAPEHARLAYAVGRLARDRGEYARAETWLRASIRLARGHDWHTYALAYLSLGTLYQQLGNLPAARAVTQRGLRTTVRRRLRRLQGTAYHNLFAIATEMLDFQAGYDSAQSAFERYGPSHPRFPALVHDVGCFWILQGCFARATAVLRDVLPRITAPQDRALVLANLARAAAAAGYRDQYTAACAESLSLLPEVESPERTAQVWLNLARAAASAGDYPRADDAARRAVAMATPLRLGHIQLEVEALQQSMRAASAAGERRWLPAGQPGLEDRAEALARQILPSLREPAAA
jgi:tetratricopeptide (TPR) repeat protein